jgi:hypothetical protein
MNDSVKYMIASGAIACVSMGVGVVIGWKLGCDGGRKTGDRSSFQPSSVSGRPSSVIGSKPFQISPSVFPTARGTNARFVVSRGTNVVAGSGKGQTGRVNGRLVTSSPTVGTSNPAYQKVQNEPEVVKAREELVASQKRAADVMERTMKETAGGISFEAFHKIQDRPEVKKAREEAAEAQRRYFEAMKKAAGNGQIVVGSSQIGGGSGQPAKK